MICDLAPYRQTIVIMLPSRLAYALSYSSAFRHCSSRVFVFH